MEAKRIINPNGTFCYTLNGKFIRRASKRYYSYMLVINNGTSAMFIGLGNNPTTLLRNWKHLFQGQPLEVIEIE